MNDSIVQLRYRLSFHTPAFLGNAEQLAQWRTPPIKALLRQWWRVVFAADQPKGADVAAMRLAEGRLFGHAWLEDDRVESGSRTAARRSQVRMRLSSWGVGKLPASRWAPLPSVRHPEVGHPVPADLYLGYGPVTLPRGQRAPTLKASAAIQEGESAELHLAVPASEGDRLRRALGLMNLYGTLGGRSRNGWGSFSLVPLASTPALATELESALTLPWRDALVADWPQALGRDDDRPLIWQTEALPDWQQLMRRLAQVKIGLRTQFLFPHQRPDGQVHERHWLSYPVTTHKVHAWDKDNLRLPNSLRFKARPTVDGKLRGVIFHMPCLPPQAFKPDRRDIEHVWQKVHDFLDADRSLQRSPA